MSVTLYHGDCLEVMRGIPDASVDAVVTDPPYAISSLPSKVERAKYTAPLRQFVYGGWDMAFDTEGALSEMMRVLSPTGTIYVFCASEQISGLLLGMRAAGCSVRTLAWVKPNPNIANGQHLWLPAVELVAFGRRAKAVFNARCRAGVWWETPPRAREHPTQKPLDIVTDFITASTHEGMAVLDPFMGSGTTGVACVNTGRAFVGIEKDAGYFEIAQKRIEAAQVAPRQLELVS